MTGQLNRRITIKSWPHEVDEGGGVSAVVGVSWTMWAKGRARSGTFFTGQEQALWNYDYEWTFRYAPSRIVQSNMTIDYDNKRMKINSISFLEEGKRKFCVARCTTTDENIINDSES